MPSEYHGLGAPDDERVRVVGGDADLEGLVREDLRLVEAPTEKRERRLQPRHVVPLHRLPEVFDRLGRCLRRSPGVLDASQLEEIARAVNVADVRELGVVGAFAQTDQLGRDGEALVEVTRIREGRVPHASAKASASSSPTRRAIAMPSKPTSRPRSRCGVK